MSLAAPSAVATIPICEASMCTSFLAVVGAQQVASRVGLTRRNRLKRYAPLSLDVMQVGVILVGSFMVHASALLICAALSVAIFVLRVLAHRAACARLKQQATTKKEA